MLRPETKSRARALQLLYAWELQGGRRCPVIASGLSRLTGPEPRILDRAEELAPTSWPRSAPSMRSRPGERELAARAASRVVERNILRLGIHELRRGNAPPKVAIDEAVTSLTGSAARVRPGS